MRLRVRGHYSAFDREVNEDVAYKPGQIVETTEARAKRLIRDSPSSFEVLDGAEVDPGGPDEGSFSPDPDPEPTPVGPVRGQQPLRPGSRIADERRVEPDGSVANVSDEKRAAAEAAAGSDSGDDNADDETGTDDEGDTPDDTGDTPSDAGGTPTDEGGAVDVDALTMPQLKALVAERGFEIKTVGRSTADVRADVRAALAGDDDAEGD